MEAVISFPLEPMGDDGDETLTCIACGLSHCEWMITVNVPHTGKITWTAIHERCRIKATDKRQLHHDQAMAALQRSVHRVADQRDEARRRVVKARAGLGPLAAYADAADEEGWEPLEWTNSVILDIARDARTALREIEKP